MYRNYVYFSEISENFPSFSDSSKIIFKRTVFESLQKLLTVTDRLSHQCALVEIKCFFYMKKMAI